MLSCRYGRLLAWSTRKTDLHNAVRGESRQLGTLLLNARTAQPKVPQKDCLCAQPYIERPVRNGQCLDNPRARHHSTVHDATVYWAEKNAEVGLGSIYE